jgi:hypothetical protein
MTRKEALELWETRIANCEATPQALWPIAKSLLKRDGPKAPTAIHGFSGLKFHPSQKANATADYLENLFTPVTVFSVCVCALTADPSWVDRCSCPKV